MTWGLAAERLLTASAAGRTAGLRVAEVAGTLHQIAEAQGPGSQGRKLALLTGLLGQATPLEARYLCAWSPVGCGWESARRPSWMRYANRDVLVAGDPLPMNTRPPATSGVLVKSPSAVPRHSGWHDSGWPQPRASRWYSLSDAGGCLLPRAPLGALLAGRRAVHMVL